MMRYLTVSLLLIASGVLAETSPKCVSSVCPANQITIAGRSYTLKGAAKFRYLFFDLYVAALYLPSPLMHSDVLAADVEKVLVLHYLRDIPKENLISGSEQQLASNPEIDLKGIQAELARLYGVFQNVTRGDRYALVYRPGSGTQLLFNDNAVADFISPQFMRAYFGIWLSNYSVSRELTSQLLRSEATVRDHRDS